MLVILKRQGRDSMRKRIRNYENEFNRGRQNMWKVLLKLLKNGLKKHNKIISRFNIVGKIVNWKLGLKFQEHKEIEIEKKYEWTNKNMENKIIAYNTEFGEYQKEKDRNRSSIP